MTWAVIEAFLAANWYWFLISYLVIGFICKIFKFTGIIFKIIYLPFWLLGIFLTPCFRSIRNARAERKRAERIE